MSNPISARAEGIDHKPMFADLLEGRRCPIPAHGFYERAKGRRGKDPHHFQLRGGGLFALAGLWDAWHGGGPPLTCCVVTTEANDLVKPLHDRMPVTPDRGNFGHRLSPDAGVPDWVKLPHPYPADRMEAVAVGPSVYSVKSDGPACIEPAA